MPCASELTLCPHFQLMRCSSGGEEESGDICLFLMFPPFDRHWVGGVTSANANACLLLAAARSRFTFRRVVWWFDALGHSNGNSNAQPRSPFVLRL